MVHLLNDYNTNLPHEISKRQIFSKLIICHIDESSIYDDSQSTINQVENLFEKYNCQFIGVKLEHIYSPDYTFSGSCNRDLEVINNNFDRSKQTKENSNNNINALLDGIPNNKLTTKQDFIWHLKLNLLTNIARKNG
nr:16054_t:CDS:2 [Entrophospora candida]